MALLRLVFVLMRFPSIVWLTTRLMMDRRVPLWLKLIIPAGVVYCVIRIDIIPDILPIFGRIDDLMVIAGSVLAFLLLSPKEIRSEHLGTGGRASTTKSGPSIIDGEYHIVDDGERSKR